MKRPLISIVTPSFNQAEFLEQTIRSVLSQAGRGSRFDLQYFVIDGGSTDHTVDVIGRYESELAGWCSEPDRGQTHAINKGFQRCDGDLLAYINSDDYYLPGAFEAVVDAWEADPQRDFIFGTCHHVDEAGELIRPQTATITSFAEMLDLWQHWLRYFDNRNFVQPEVFWTRRLSRQLGGFDESRHYAMDFDYWLRGFDAGMRIHQIDQPLSAFRIHGAQKTSQIDQTRLELMAIVDPYLQRPDPRIDSQDRERMIALNAMERAMILQREESATIKLRKLAKLATEHPVLLQQRFYWRHLRRSGKRLVRWPAQRRAA
ncbi:Chondroitin synthase [Crateriforma conspicua]|uniref:Chondroitin synthase n=1 Tax=Crateriforma conspicua TaxID=2527996 RepID=A0A5C6FS92_9PLAN|nr:glycosyltransferase family 2 protein [Crateriforma conspicua]TWU63383.1 Chondroitin synthase [Crateriforma conspicua]